MLSNVAKEFVGIKFEKMDGVLGVLLTGSASIGYIDSLADIDLEIVATEGLCRKLGGIRGSQEYHGLDVSWKWVTLKELENACMHLYYSFFFLKMMGPISVHVLLDNL